MERWIGRVALVTGASVGIGAAVCRKLVKSGITVLGCARNLQKLQELANDDEIKNAPGRLDVVKCDLSEESDILNMFDVIRSKYGRIDICINNAGFSTDSPLLTGQTEDWRKMFEVNVLGLCVCSREAVKLMQEKSIDDGQIIHICSIGGHRLPMTDSMPGVSFYCGTKFMVRCLTEGLRRELKSLNGNIRVSSISPGLVETEFVRRTMGEEKAEDFKGAPSLKSDDIANAVLYILQSPPYVDVSDIIIQPVGGTV